MPQPKNFSPLGPATLDALDPRIEVPAYDRSALGGGMVHIGVGGFHRAHQAEYLDDLCNQGLTEWSITGTGLLAGDASMADVLDAQDGLYSLLSRSQTGTDVRVIGSITNYVLAHPDVTPLVDLLAQPETRIVSLTVTEGGYPVAIDTGEPTGASSNTFSAIVAALDRRRSEGLAPFSVMSCDNVMHNGIIAKKATIAAAEDKHGSLANWIEREVAFPSTMVDRITPATTDADRAFLAEEYGLIDQWPVVTEPFRQWVIEDEFSNGRPPWEDAGVMLTDDVAPYELLKLRLLNAGHSSIAYLGALAGFTFVHEVMADPAFEKYLRRFLDEEATPALPPIPGIDIAEYKRSVVERFSNPEIQDQVSRLCLDGSSKFPIFLIPTIETQLASGASVDLSMLALAGWCQYLLGRNDAGEELTIAADPELDLAMRYARSSVEDPISFLDFAQVFPATIRSNPLACDAFENALRSVRGLGARAAVAERT